MSKNGNENDYEVGYGKPPKNSQFKKGQSGNPKGRPKGEKNKKSVIREVIERKVTIRQNGEKRQASVFEALVESIVAHALEGSINDQIKLMQLIEKYAPEKLEDRSYGPQKVIVEFVDSDGNGRPADRSLWEPWQWEWHRREVEERNKDPEVIARWKAAGLDDDEDEAKGRSNR